MSKQNSAAAPFPMTGVEKRFVLLAEDDQDIREMLRDSIRVEGALGNLQFEVIEATDGTDAIEKASKHRFHCVVTDLKMPNADGEDLLKALQKSSLNANTPMLVVSGHADLEFCERYAHIRVIPKPVEPNIVAQAVVREVRLGPIDDRVPLHLLNPILDSLQQFMADELGEAIRVLQPAVKKSLEPLAGDFLCALSFSTNVTKTKIYFCIDTALLEAVRSFACLQSKASNFANLPEETLARLFVTELFERSQNGLSARMGSTPRLTGLSISGSKSGNEANEVLFSSGVAITVECDQGRVSVGAFARPKTKKT